MRYHAPMGCAADHLPGSANQERYADFGRRVHREAFRKRIPIAGSLALTHRCNLRCAHCYLPPGSPVDELTTAEWLGLLEQFETAGCLWLLLTGGEPLLRPDFEAIYLDALRRGFLVTVFSNGTTFDEERLALFAHHPPFALEISLYGSSAHTCQTVCGDGSAAEAARRAAVGLRERGVPLQLKTVALRANVHELPELQRLARELGVDFRFDTLISPRLDGERGPLRCRLDEARCLELDEADDTRRRAWSRVVAAGPPAPRRELFTCSAGRTAFHVHADGTLALCLNDLPLADLRRVSFREAWDGPVRLRRERALPAGHPCFGCTDQPFCGVCPPLARMETGDELGVPRELCDSGRRRRRMLERPAVRQTA